MNVLKDIRFWLVIGGLCLTLFLWLATGLISTGEPPAPLSLLHRSVLMFAFLTAIISLIFAIHLSSRRANTAVLNDITDSEGSQSGGDPGLLDEEEQQLRNKFAEAASMLKNKRFGSFGNKQHLYQMPWYIVIGSPGSGKTTAIRHSGLEFPLDDLTQGNSLGGVGGTRNCDWWITNQAVLLDTAGRYTTQDSDARYDAQGWQNFLALLRKNRKQQPINGAVIVISTDEILRMGDNEWKQHSRTLTTRLRELVEELNMDFPVYLLMTKVDLLPGCREFFETLDVEEQEQIWGTTLPLDGSPDALDQSLNQLAARLHDQVPTKLRYERDPKRRQAIYSFPWQIETLNRRLASLVQDVFSRQGVKEHTRFRGVYFTSAIQEGTPIERLFAAVASGFGVSGSISGRPEQSRSLFLRQLFPQVIFRESFLAGTNTAHDKRRQRLRLVAFVGILALGVGLAVAWTGAFTIHRNLLVGAESHLANFQQSPHGPDRPLDTNMSAMGNLAMAAEVFDQQRYPFLSNFGMYDGSVDKAAEGAYLRSVESLVVPATADATTSWLGALRSRDYQENLEALKAYLMLTDSGRRDSEWLLAWLDYTPITALHSGAPGELSGHIGALLEARPDYQLEPVDETTVERSRAFLQRARNGEALYSHMKSVWWGAETDILDRLGPYFTSTFATADPDQFMVPTLYTVAGYLSLDFSLKSDSVRGWLGDRWVIGAENAPSPVEITAAIDEARRLYARDYIATWRSVLNSVELTVPGRKDELSDMLGYLSDPTLSPMSALLAVVSEETQLPGDSETVEAAKQMAADAARTRTGRLGRAAGNLARAGGTPKNFDIPGEVADAFGQFHAMQRGGNVSKDAKVASQLGDLRQWLNGLTAGQSENPSRRLLLTANDLADPFSSWTTALAQSAQGHMTNQQYGQISARWRSQVGQACSEAFDGRFPFNYNASAQATLRDFEEFFEPDGIEHGFVKRELKPLVSSGKIKLSRNAEEAIRNGERVRDAFFPNGRDLGFKYQLLGVNVDDRIGQLIIETGDGQRVRFRHGPPVPLELNWPDGDRGLRVTFQLKDGSTRRQLVDGPWAMFRAVADSRTNAGRNSGSSSQLVTFSDGQHNATFRITSSTRVNPFQPGLLDGYRCRSSL